MESNKLRNLVISCCVLLLVGCLCLGLIVVSGLGVAVVWPLESQAQHVLPLPAVSTLQAEDPTIDMLPTPGDGFYEGLPGDLAETLVLIQGQVSKIRGLSLSEPVTHTLISAEELREIVMEEFFSDYSDEDARKDVLILSLLGLLPDDFDLKGFYQDLYSEQIAGFYDSDTKEIFVVQGSKFGGNEKLTYAHEYTHALQDYVFKFDEGMNYNEEACETDAERCTAIRALIEGDATQTEILWFQTYATREDYDDLRAFFDDFESPVLDQAPPFMAADLLFPYEKGFAFVESLYKAGGFTAVDAAYLNPPVSTTQILHPEKYPNVIPQIVALPDLNGLLEEGWDVYDENIMGEWYTFLILSKAYDEAYRLPESVAARAVEGWGGDTYAFYLNESTDEVFFILESVWDSTNDAQEFADAFSQYADLRWGSQETQVRGGTAWGEPGLSTLFFLKGNRTVWVSAPSVVVAESIMQFIK